MNLSVQGQPGPTLAGGGGQQGVGHGYGDGGGGKSGTGSMFLNSSRARV